MAAASSNPTAGAHSIAMKLPAAGSEAEALHDALRALRESELRFRAAIDATADGIHVVDVDTMRFIDVNETACRTLGYTRDEFLQLAIPDIAPDADLQRLAGLYERLFNGEDNEQSAEIVHCRRDGTRIPIEIRRRGVILGGRRVAVNVVRDITANKRTEAMIRRHALQQSLIAAFGQRALATSDLDELMTRAATLICEGLEVGCARVVQLADDERSLVLKAAVGWPDTAMGAPVPDGERRLRPLLASGAPAFINAEGEVPCDGGPPIANGVEVAIAGARGACGVLGAYAGADRAFTQRSADFLQNLANTLATAM